MKYYLVTIETSYSTEDFLIPVLDGEIIELATDRAFGDIAFCEDWEIIKYREVGTDYLKAVSIAQKAYLELTGESVAEVFTSGKYTPLDDIMAEIEGIKKRRERSNDI